MTVRIRSWHHNLLDISRLTVSLCSNFSTTPDQLSAELDENSVVSKQLLVELAININIDPDPEPVRNGFTVFTNGLASNTIPNCVVPSEIVHKVNKVLV